MADAVIQIMNDVSEALPPLIPGVTETIEQGEAVNANAALGERGRAWIAIPAW